MDVLVEGLGFENVLIRGIDSKTFLAYFQMEDNLDKVDLDFLVIAFHKVRKVQWEDLIPTRRTWVECRGIPTIL